MGAYVIHIAAQRLRAVLLHWCCFCEIWIREDCADVAYEPCAQHLRLLYIRSRCTTTCGACIQMSNLRPYSFRLDAAVDTGLVQFVD